MAVIRRMVGAARFLFHTAYQATVIRGQGSVFTRKKLVLTYLRIRAKHFATKLLPRLNISQEALFGYSMHFFDYFAFASLYECLFLNKDYYFEARSPQPLVVDCGSNFGMAVLFMKVLHPQCRIVAFEPDAATFQMLKANVERNGWNDVELHNQALAGTAGELDFYYDPTQPGLPLMSIDKMRGPAQQQRVQGVLLSDFIAEEVDFLKMDIEGAEEGVLNELTRTGKLRLVREMVLEYHHHIDPAKDKFGNILRLLEDHGFGYEIAAYPERPMRPERFQDVLVYAYRR